VAHSDRPADGYVGVGRQPHHGGDGLALLVDEPSPLRNRRLRRHLDGAHHENLGVAVARHVDGGPHQLRRVLRVGNRDEHLRLAPLGGALGHDGRGLRFELFGLLALGVAVVHHESERHPDDCGHERDEALGARTESRRQPEFEEQKRRQDELEDDADERGPRHVRNLVRPREVGVGRPHLDDGPVHLDEQEDEHDVGGGGDALDGEQHGHEADEDRRETDCPVGRPLVVVDASEEAREDAVAPHGERHPRRGVDGRVERAHRRREPGEQEQWDAVRDELPGGLDDAEFAEVPEDLPRRRGGRESRATREFGGHVDAADGREGDEDVDGDHDCHRVEHRLRDVGAGVDDLFARLDDYLVALEGDVGKAHRADDTDEAVGRERRTVEEGRRPVRLANRREDAEDHEDAEDENLDSRDDDARFPRLLGPTVVDVGEREHHHDREQFLHEQAVEQPKQDEPVGQAGEHHEELGEKDAERHGVERARDGVGEPAHPPGVEAVGVDQRLFHPEVAAARLGERRPEFGVGDGGEHRHQSVEYERHRERRAGQPSRESGQREDARADHRADADERDIGEAHVAREFRFHRLFTGCVTAPSGRLCVGHQLNSRRAGRKIPMCDAPDSSRRRRVLTRRIRMFLGRVRLGALPAEHRPRHQNYGVPIG